MQLAGDKELRCLESFSPTQTPNKETRKIHYHSIKEHLKLSKIAKFGCEVL